MSDDTNQAELNDEANPTHRPRITYDGGFINVPEAVLKEMDQRFDEEREREFRAAVQLSQVIAESKMGLGIYLRHRERHGNTEAPLPRHKKVSKVIAALDDLEDSISLPY